MTFTDAQYNAITLPHNLVVTAGAGSGKTRVLVERYLRLLLEGAQPAAEQAGQTGQIDLAALIASHSTDILAITFTDKAAREMRERVRLALENRLHAASDPTEQAVWEEHRAAIEAAPIGTIHSFCMNLLRAQPAETGLDPQFALLDEIQMGMLIAESVEDALADAAASTRHTFLPDDQFRVLQQDFGLNGLRSMLAEMLQGGSEVRAAIDALPTTPAALLAHWREKLTAAQTQAFEELRSGTAWRAACETVLRLAPAAPAKDKLSGQLLAAAEWLHATGMAGQQPGEPPLLPANFAPLLAVDLRVGSAKAWGSADTLKAAKDALGTLRDRYKQDRLLTFVPDDNLEQRTAQAAAGLCALYWRVLERYTQRKERQNVLDFDDLERLTRALLEREPGVRARWQAEFQAVLVDEFQDTNHEQRAIIYALAGFLEPEQHEQPSAAPLHRPALFVVGDGKQSIYRFRGADVSVFREVQEDIQAQQGRRVALDTSFRSHPLLLNWINEVTRAVFARERPLLPYEIPFEPLTAHRPEPPHPHCVELHIISEAENVEQARISEARLLAERIKAIVEGAAGCLVHDNKEGWRVPRYGDIALLCQASTVFGVYEEALRAAGIPYLTTAGRGYYGRQEVQDLIHLLRVINDPTDELALVGVLRSPLFAIDDAAIIRLRLNNQQSLWHALMNPPEPPEQATAEPDERARALAFACDTLRHLHALRGRLTVVQLLREALAATGYLATISGLTDGAQRRANVEKLIEAARLSGTSGVFAFSEYLEKLLRAEPREGEAPLEAEGSVRLMTVHKSKGLEFPIVVLPDLGRNPPNPGHSWLARRSYGLALRMRDDVGDTLKPTAYQLALHEEQRMERAERERLLYVALTRARDYLILSGTTVRAGADAWLSRLLAALDYPPESGGIPAGAYGPLQMWQY